MAEQAPDPLAAVRAAGDVGDKLVHDLDWAGVHGVWRELDPDMVEAARKAATLRRREAELVPMLTARLGQYRRPAWRRAEGRVRVVAQQAAIAAQLVLDGFRNADAIDKKLEQIKRLTPDSLRHYTMRSIVAARRSELADLCTVPDTLDGRLEAIERQHAEFVELGTSESLRIERLSGPMPRASRPEEIAVEAEFRL